MDLAIAAKMPQRQNNLPKIPSRTSVSPNPSANVIFVESRLIFMKLNFFQKNNIFFFLTNNVHLKIKIQKLIHVPSAVERKYVLFIN